MQPRSMKHYPQIVYCNAQHLTDFLARMRVDLSQGKRARGALRQRRETIAEYFPKITSLHQLHGGRMPISGRMTIVPMTLPLIRSFKKLAMFRSLIRSFTDRSFTANVPKMIDNLML